MKILLVAATLAEIAPFLEKKQLLQADWIETEKVDICVTGVGMVATAFRLGQVLADQKYRLVLNVGVAGAFDKETVLGTVFQITDDCFSELGAENNEAFISIDEMGFGKSIFTSTATILPDLPIAKAITVNTVHGSELSVKRIGQRFPHHLESMEGAAVFYACQQHATPVAQVRSVSNWIEPRNRASWDLKLAINMLNLWLIDFVKLL